LVQLEDLVSKEPKDSQERLVHRALQELPEVQDPLELPESTVHLVQPVLLELPEHPEVPVPVVFSDHRVLRGNRVQVARLELLERVVFPVTQERLAQTVRPGHKECQDSLALPVPRERQGHLAGLEIKEHLASRELKAFPVYRALPVTRERLERLVMLDHLVL